MVTIEPWNPFWKEEFESLKKLLIQQLPSFQICIEHVGSTSVEGLPAKPCLDIDIIAEKKDDIPVLIEKLSLLGYQHIGDLGIKGREAFKRENEEVPYSGDFSRKWMRHNLYLGIKGIPSIENHLKFRNFLRENPEKMKEYGDLKRNLSVLYKNDQPKYTEAKSDFILKILETLGFDDRLLSDIREQNKA